MSHTTQANLLKFSRFSLIFVQRARKRWATIFCGIVASICSYALTSSCSHTHRRHFVHKFKYKSIGDFWQPAELELNDSVSCVSVLELYSIHALRQKQQQWTSHRKLIKKIVCSCHRKCWIKLVNCSVNLCAHRSDKLKWWTWRKTHTSATKNAIDENSRERISKSKNKIKQNKYIYLWFSLTFFSVETEFQVL